MMLAERQCGLAVSYIDSLTNQEKIHIHIQSRCCYPVVADLVMSYDPVALVCCAYWIVDTTTLG